MDIAGKPEKVHGRLKILDPVEESPLGAVDAVCQDSCRMKVIFISIIIDYIHAAFNCRALSLLSFGGFSQT